MTDNNLFILEFAESKTLWNEKVPFSVGLRPCTRSKDHNAGLMNGNPHFIWNGKEPHLILKSLYGHVYVSEIVLEYFSASELTGFVARPADITTIEGISCNGYYELQRTTVSGFAGAECGIELLEKCSCCGRVEYSPLKFINGFNEIELDPFHDFMCIWPLASWFISERAKKVIDKFKVKGLFTPPISKSRLSKYKDGFGPVLQYLIAEPFLEETRQKYPEVFSTGDCD